MIAISNFVEKLNQIELNESISLNKLNESDSSEFESSVRFVEDVNVIATKTWKHIDELLRLRDVQFVYGIYYCFLQREPDPQGLSYYLDELRSSRKSKLDLILEIKNSEEAIEINNRVKGIKLKILAQTFTNLPLIGWVVNLLLAIKMLSKLKSRLLGIENELIHISLAVERLSEDIAISRKSNAVMINEKLEHVDNRADKIMSKLCQLKKKL